MVFGLLVCKIRACLALKVYFFQTFAAIPHLHYMETFVTQFMMSGVNTYVTVQVLSDNKFGFALHLSDSFEGGEMVPAKDATDGVLVRDHGNWALQGESKISLSKEDVQNLGAAIEDDYLLP
jgi:hypothetical protein